jgi:hypothetical protein
MEKSNSLIKMMGKLTDFIVVREEAYGIQLLH